MSDRTCIIVLTVMASIMFGSGAFVIHEVSTAVAQLHATAGQR